MRTRFVVAAATASLLAMAPPGAAIATGPPTEARTECPRELSCSFAPAAEGRYAPADRPRDGVDIRYIVIHDVEGTYDQTIKFFQDPKGSTSAHYLLRSADGAVTQFVANEDVAYHSGNFWFNMHSIGIEHEGFLAEGARWYTDEMYRASAALVRHLAATYDIPLDRHHILGHDEIAPPNAERVRNMHTDPGPYWDWARYFDFLGVPLPARAAAGQTPTGSAPDLPPASQAAPRVVTIFPRFDENDLPFQTCTQEACTTLPAQGSNAVYLRTGPAFQAPLISDPVLRPDRSPGTENLEDLSARAVAGQRFVVAGRFGEWTAIWFGGQIAWFHDPQGSVGAPGRAMVVTPRRATIPVYGDAYPEPSAYPSGVERSDIVPLPFTIIAGQYYVGGAIHRSDDLATVEAGQGPKQRVHVVGGRRLVEISFNHRRAFLDFADVTVLK